MSSKKDYIFLGAVLICCLAFLVFIGCVYVYVGLIVGASIGSIISLLCAGTIEFGFYPGAIIGALSGLVAFIFMVLRHSIPLIDTMIDRYSYKE